MLNKPAVSLMTMLLALSVLFLSVTALAQGPIDTTFTFQGRLIQNNAFVTDTCNFQFTLFDDPTAGTQQGPTINKTGVSVQEGYFTADLDFGSVFSGAKRYLQVAVQCSADGGLIALTGRMELTGTPYTLYALNSAAAGNANWANITAIPSPDFADNIDNTGELNNFTCSNGQILVALGPGSWACGTDAGSVPNTLDHGIHLITTSLADDDHPHYFLADGSRAMGGNLNMANRRITNLGDGINPTDAANRAQTVEQPETGGDLAGTYNNALVVGLRNRPITITALVNGDGLTWNGTQWQNGLVQPSGPAGGDFTGTFPNPQIAANAVGAPEIITDAVGASEIAANAVDATKIVDNAVDASEIIADGVNTSEIGPNAVAMSELNIPMGFGSAPNVDLAIDANYMGFTPAFTPDAAGTCMVVASASLQTTGSSIVEAVRLRTAMQTGGNSSGTNYIDFGRSQHLPSVSVSDVWAVSAGVSTRFGCYVFVFDSGAQDDEIVDCRVSYVCQ